MLKRLNERFATKSHLDTEKLNEYGFVPSAEEIHNPNLNFQQIQKMKQRFNFEGEFQCSLCPKKILDTKLDLQMHLGSKFHAENVKRYFKRNKKELEKKINETYKVRCKGISKYSSRFKKLTWLSHYFKVKNSLK
ncbi:UNKNOWN [Stylonychia lemnae]|uniref:Uncharacterized protein n=1 Tax=Stylonychia lemnae TaxID=5949 RepID=A0A078B8X0_STYLE|nr:UNKNOWN [Stylonychia lemnae]|eukprot:CDW90940.1 UNKNOWN [Stylonychia lemnae]